MIIPMKKLRSVLFILGILALPFAVHAAQDAVQQNVLLSKSEIVNDNFVRFGQDITIQGTVHGDVILAGSTMTVDGTVDGDVIAVGQTVRINGTVGGNLRVAAQTIILSGSVGRNVSLLAETIHIDEKATVGWSVQSAGRSLALNGTVNGNAHFYGAMADMRGTVNGNAFFGMSEDGTLRLSEPASIGKDLTYQANEQLAIPAGVTVSGAVRRQEPAFRESDLKQFFRSLDIYSRVASIFGALVVGLVLVSLLPRWSNRVVAAMRAKAARSFGWGALLAVAIPVLAIILLFTIIGIPLAIITLLLYGIAWYVTRVYLGLFVGTWIMSRFGKKYEHGANIWVMALGVAIVSLIGWIPSVGWILTTLASLWAFGALILTKRESLLAEERQTS